METIIGFYVIMVPIVWLIISIMALEEDAPEEVDSFWSGVFYGILFPIFILKHFIKFIPKIFK